MGTETGRDVVPTHSGWVEFTGYRDGAKRSDDNVTGMFTTPSGSRLPKGNVIRYDYKIEQNRAFAQLYGKRMRTALIVDVHSLYIGCQRKYPGKVIDYTEFVSATLADGSLLFQRIAYGRQAEETVPQFAKMLRRHLFDLKFGPGPQLVPLVLDVASMIGACAMDHLILATNDPQLAPLTQYARRCGLYTTVYTVDAEKAFESSAMVNLINESLIQ